MEYICDCCSYKTKNKTDFAKHVNTKKHERWSGFSEPLITKGVYSEGNELQRLKARVKYLESRLRELGQKF